MIEPVRSGQALLNEIRDTQPGSGALAIWWLGQSGFLIKSATATILIDPYLSEYLTKKYEGTGREHVRMTRSPIRGTNLVDVDLVLVSHKHSDHLDPGTIPDLLAASPAATLILPASLLDHARSLGIASERLRGLRGGEIGGAGDLSIRAIPSAHEGLDTDDAGRHLYLGYVVEIGGLRLYHSGDSVAYDGLARAIGPEPMDVMFLPINGRDPARGVPGNMTAAEAVDLANLVAPRFVVPHHYDMFTFNTVPVSAFEAEARRLASRVSPKVLRVGERWEISR
jgi:L-ascorbate 6-phosphate lactonase